jgi:hypothetical protein
VSRLPLRRTRLYAGPLRVLRAYIRRCPHRLLGLRLRRAADNFQARADAHTDTHADEHLVSRANTDDDKHQHVEPAAELVRRTHTLFNFNFFVLIKQCMDRDLVVGRAFFDLGGRDECFVQCTTYQQLGGA